MHWYGLQHSDRKYRGMGIRLYDGRRSITMIQKDMFEDWKQYYLD